MTRDHLREQMAISEEKEAQTYKSLTIELFREIQDRLKLLYDQTAAATANFTAITRKALKSNPRIVKTLRYCLAPVISQMRLGQLIGLNTTESFEEQGSLPTDELADRLAQWFNDYLDLDRFQWLTHQNMSAAERRVAEISAKLWTVSLQANQNTATKYRTQRKEQQENAIATALEGMGLKHQQNLGLPQQRPTRRKRGDPPHPPRQKRLGGINSVDDVLPGHYVKEKKILGGSQKKQKSDLTARPGYAPELFCVEAKAVGIKLDSTKRLKELNDKYTDWKGSSLPIITVGVVAGMFSDAELVATIKERQIPIFFEHDLVQLVEFMKFRVYYGEPWNPNTLFAEVPETEITEALENIRTVQMDGDAKQQTDAEAGGNQEV